MLLLTSARLWGDYHINPICPPCLTTALVPVNKHNTGLLSTQSQIKMGTVVTMVDDFGTVPSMSSTVSHVVDYGKPDRLPPSSEHLLKDTQAPCKGNT